MPHFSPVKSILVASVLSVAGVCAVASPESDALNAAVKLRAAGDWQAARTTATGVGRDVIEWQYLRAGKGRFDECTAFLERHADWPGLPLLAEKCEASISDAVNPRDVVAYFNNYPPQTGAGTVALTRAYQLTGADGDAQAQAVIGWQTLVMDAESESHLLTQFPTQIAPHNPDRARMLMWQGKFKDAARLGPYLPRVVRADRCGHAPG